MVGLHRAFDWKDALHDPFGILKVWSCIGKPLDALIQLRVRLCRHLRSRQSAPQLAVTEPASRGPVPEHVSSAAAEEQQQTVALDTL